MLVGRLFHARATVTRNDRSPMVLSRVRVTIRRGQEPDRSRCRDSASSRLKVSRRLPPTYPTVEMFNQTHNTATGQPLELITNVITNHIMKY